MDPALGDNELVRSFYTHWFAIDPTARDLFPPDMAAQRAAFGQALWWVLGEVIEQRTEEPVEFLAQLGRDHRKYGVREQHYLTLQTALSSSFRSHLSDQWDAALDEAAHDAVALVTGLMSGAAEAEAGPAWWDGTVVEHLRVSREISVVRLHLDRPMDYHPGQFVNVGAAVPAPLALSQPCHPGRSGRHDRVPRPRGAGRDGQHGDRRRDASRRPVADIGTARCDGDRSRVAATCSWWPAAPDWPPCER